MDLAVLPYSLIAFSIGQVKRNSLPWAREMFYSLLESKAEAKPPHSLLVVCSGGNLPHYAHQLFPAPFLMGMSLLQDLIEILDTGC